MLLAPLGYESDVLRGLGVPDGRVTLPRGFVYDRESVPRLPVAYWFFANTSEPSGAVHDYLMQTHKVGGIWLTRRQTDAVYFEATGAEGPGIEPNPWWQRWGKWLGVRAGGNFGGWNDRSIIPGWGAWATGPSRLVILGWDRRRRPRGDPAEEGV